MAQKIPTLKEADRETRAAIARTTKAIARLRRELPKLQGQKRKATQEQINWYQKCVADDVKSLGR
jgi:hypothetical protein